MSQFEYVMVLVSIIIGLGIAHILVGVGGIIDRLSGHGAQLRTSLAHASWLGMIFAWMIMFWWWEFRWAELEPEWTMGLYLFLVVYAIGLFLLAVVLVPTSWDGVADLGEYFLRRRVWFYTLLLLVTVLDVIDGYLKGGWDYVVNAAGPVIWVFWIATLPVAVIGIRSRSRRYHAVAGTVFLVWQVLSGIITLPHLGF